MKRICTPTCHKPLGQWLKPAIAVVLLALLAGAVPSGHAGRNPNPGVSPPNSSAYGKSYADWGAAWWQWTLSFPLAQSPIRDTTGEFGSQGQSGPVWFLAGSRGDTVERSLTIPPGKGLFFPLLNVINDYPCPDPAFQPAPGQTLEDFLKEGAAFFVEHATELTVEVDGVPLRNLFDYRATSGLFTFTAHPSNVESDPCITGEPQPAVSDGYWVMLTPLKPGLHTIHFTSHAVFPEFGNWEFGVDVTYHLTVE